MRADHRSHSAQGASRLRQATMGQKTYLTVLSVSLAFCRKCLSATVAMSPAMIALLVSVASVHVVVRTVELRLADRTVAIAIHAVEPPLKPRV